MGKSRVNTRARIASAGQQPFAAQATLKRAFEQAKVGRWPQALELFNAALPPNSVSTAGLLGRATALHHLGRIDESIADYLRVIELRPEEAIAHADLAVAYKALGRGADALACFDKALSLEPDNVDTRYNLGNLLAKQGRLDEAIREYKQVLGKVPHHLGCIVNLGNAHKDRADLREAATMYRQALALDPTDALARSNLLFCLSHDERVSAEELFEAHRGYGAVFDGPPWPRPAGCRSRPAGAIPVLGFVSGDLRRHPVARFVEPVWAVLAQMSVPMVAYSNSIEEDEVSAQLRRHVSIWRNVSKMDDAGLAQCIASDGVDILFDLSGHTARNRLPVFGRRAAAMQISWLGYPATTGLSSMDYYVADRFLAPKGVVDAAFVEKIIRLPQAAAFLPSGDAPPVNELPARTAAFQFASFNRWSKISDRTLSLWCQVLKATPGSRMLIGSVPNPSNAAQISRRFAALGVEPSRLVFARRAPMQTYLQLHHQVDLVLDSVPYAGGSTSLHALWMGVPVLTLAGESVLSRQSAAILQHVGLHGFVADSDADYVDKAAGWARRLDELASIRRSLRERLSGIVTGQSSLVARGLLSAVQLLWNRHLAGLPPISFEVES